MDARIIKTRVWDKDDRFGELTKNGKYLFVYLISCPHINQIGMFEAPDRVIRFETSLSPKELEEAKQDLQQHRMVFFEEGWVYVINAKKHNEYSGEKNELKQEKEREAVPTHLFKDLDTPIDTPIHTPMIGPYNQYSIINNKYNKEFNDFWDAYPKKKAKAEAWKSWKRLSPEEQQLAKDSLSNHKASEDWRKDNGQYIPHPATWLNQRRWEDDVGQAATNDLSQLAKQFQTT